VSVIREFQAVDAIHWNGNAVSKARSGGRLVELGCGGRME